MYQINKKVWMMIAGAVILVLAVNNATFALNTERETKVSSTDTFSPAQDSDQKRKDENKALLELFKGLRVCDVRDAMDWIGYFGFGSIDPSVRPLWRTHAVGIARTARYLPYVGPYPTEKGEAYSEWVNWYYKNVCPYPWDKELEDGDFMCIDLSGVNSGLMGSENTLRCLAKGCRGYVFNGSGIRDTDEVIMQKIAVWSHYVSQAMDQARIQFDAKDIPIAIGGVTIYPGDIVVADGDGVIVVPRKVAFEVAKWAGLILNKDKDERKESYQKLQWQFDETVTRDANTQRLK